MGSYSISISVTDISDLIDLTVLSDLTNISDPI